MDITFKGRHTSVPERFRRHAAAKLARIEKLDQKAIRVDVEVSKERNPRQSDRSERVELTIRSRGPAIRAEAAADDRYTALDLAFAKLDARLRRACDRRKVRHADLSVRSPEVLAAISAAPAAAGGRATAAAGSPPESPGPAGPREESQGAQGAPSDQNGHAQASPDGLVPIQMEGDGPLVVREKVHIAHPMTIDQALLEMELVGHDFYLFHDSQCDKFSVVYRRRGYDYGVIRLVER
ncbi:MAG: ribosome-associated translation inhibitor RaiA [Streptosporangiaceae bacterium]|nr:ribosome-associated translation inhibitor RaiA [Streptosporangiaceae bacterium]MBV9857688.1 ribosome-associated translation inhibitor RaiA [Streptosporangiaceae bacterium]